MGYVGTMGEGDAIHETEISAFLAEIVENARRWRRAGLESGDVDDLEFHRSYNPAIVAPRALTFLTLMIAADPLLERYITGDAEIKGVFDVGKAMHLGAVNAATAFAASEMPTGLVVSAELVGYTIGQIVASNPETTRGIATELLGWHIAAYKLAHLLHAELERNGRLDYLMSELRTEALAAHTALDAI